jgi:hypothetical protein
MLSYDDFIEKARADARRCNARDLPSRAAREHADGFVAVWVTGGEARGSDGLYDLRPEPEPEVEPLLELLDDLGLRRRQVNEIKALFVRDEATETTDYHGQWETKAYKVLSIDALHEKLVEFGVVEPRPHAPGM